MTYSQILLSMFISLNPAPLHNPDIFSNDGLSKISNEILIATNEALEKYEGFGGIEKVHLLKFSFE